MFGLTKRQRKFPDIIAQDAVILDEKFSQLLIINFKSDPDIIDEELMRYVWGQSPKPWGMAWKGAKKLYMPLNLKDHHWVAVKVDLEAIEMIVYDCSLGANTEMVIDEAMLPLRMIIPTMLRASGYFEHIENHLYGPWPYKRPRNIPQNTRYVYHLLFTFICLTF